MDYAASAALTVEVLGLPQGVQGDVRVYGPDSATRLYRSLGSTQTFSVTPGTYTVSASPVTSGGDTYVPTVTGSPVTLGGGESATARVRYERQVTARLKILFSWGGVLHPSTTFPVTLSGPTSGIYQGHHVDFASQAAYSLPAGRYTVTAPGPSTVVEASNGNGFLWVGSYTDYFFYPCDYPRENCTARQGTLPTGGVPRNFAFDLPETGGTLVIVGSTYSLYSHGQGITVRFCFPASLNGQTATVPVTRYGVTKWGEWVQVSSADPLPLSLSTRESPVSGLACASLDYTPRSFTPSGSAYTYPGFGLELGDATVGGTTYYPVVRQAGGLWYKVTGGTLTVVYTSSRQYYAWYQPLLGQGLGWTSGGPTLNLSITASGNLPVYSNFLRGGNSFIGRSEWETSSAWGLDLYASTAHTYTFKARPFAFANSPFILSALGSPPDSFGGEATLSQGVQTLDQAPNTHIRFWRKSGQDWHGEVPVTVNLSRGSCSYGVVYVRRDSDPASYVPSSEEYTWWNFSLPVVPGQVRSGMFNYFLPPGTYDILFHRVPGCGNSFSVRVDRPGQLPLEYTGDTVRGVRLEPGDTLWIDARY